VYLYSPIQCFDTVGSGQQQGHSTCKESCFGNHQWFSQWTLPNLEKQASLTKKMKVLSAFGLTCQSFHGDHGSGRVQQLDLENPFGLLQF